jgi:transglutaminase-like putative cysteine protease
MAATYRVEHDTKYVYGTPVATSQHVAYLRPRSLDYQHVHRHELRVEPGPASSARRVDFFGNLVDQFQILRPHSRLLVSAESIVEVLARPSEEDLEVSPRWEEVSRELMLRAGTIPPSVPQYAQRSPYVLDSCEMAAFAEPSFPAGRPLLEGAVDLMHRIHDGFDFDPQATTLTTPLARVLEERRGVCQDFAHVAVGCLRSIGLAARYVSGYLLTDPPPGQPRLVGADASHAWIGVYCPINGWIALDPTNDVIIGERHVTVAWGRDYGDVSPLRGVLLGGADHTLHVAVSVTPLSA